MNKKQKKVIRAEYHKPGCWILISAKKADHKYDDFLTVDYIMSFLYDTGKVAAEWEPRYGPIQMWEKCDEDSEGAKEHYFYDWENTPPTSWSQLSVEREEGLKEMFLESNWDGIFDVLKSWASSR